MQPPSEPSAHIRVLVVDDHESYRHFVTVTLRSRPDLKVVGEVPDGLEAIRQAQMLRPDLIVLDIGLASLNGIEAARQIGQVASQAKIIFLTQESSAEIVREAFNLGARGYVVKAQAGAELLVAVDAVLRGDRFVSSGLEGHGQPGSE